MSPSSRPLPLLRRLLSATTAASSPNFYALLGLRETFELSAAQLSDRFKAMQREWHPDRFGRSPPATRERAAAMSARLNEAYATLREPAARAAHLLEIRGAPAHTAADLDPDFLHWVVETREAVATAANDSEKLAALRSDTASHILACLTRISNSFQAADLAAAASHTAELQYLRRIEHAITQASDS